jgi:hypothetical protein
MTVSRQCPPTTGAEAGGGGPNALVSAKSPSDNAVAQLTWLKLTLLRGLHSCLTEA